VKKHAAFKGKDAISGFPVSPGSAEALVRCGGKIKCILIAYFLGNICAKNCRNRTMYVKIIASCKGGMFFETWCRISPVRDRRSTPLEWLSSTRDLDLESDHTAYRHASLIELYLHIKFH